MEPNMNISSLSEEPEAIPSTSRLLEESVAVDDVLIRTSGQTTVRQEKGSHHAHQTGNVFRSRMFVFIFVSSIVTQCLGIADVGTDIAQAVVFWLWQEPTRCETQSLSTKNNYVPLNASWFVLTLLAIYLPALVCVLRHPAKKVLYGYLYHPLSSRSLNGGNVNAVEDCEASGCSNFLSFLILFDVFFLLPFLLVLKQFKQLLLLMHIQHREKLVAEPLNSPRNSGRENSASVNKDQQIDHSRLVVEIVHEALRTQKKPIISKRAVLVNELVQLSDDRQEGAMLEAAPQLILNLTIIIRYGGSMLRHFSALFSLTSLVISTASYSINKLKKNPVKREVNMAGIVLISLTKFPCIVSRCASIAILFSIQSAAAMAVGWVFLALFTVLGGLYEYMNLDKSYRKMTPQLVLQILTRGWTSVFILPEYRSKRCVGGSCWLDESDDESMRGESKEPKSRLLNQIVYLIVQILINLAFGIWCYIFTESSDILCLLNTNPNARNAAIVVVMIGAPVSSIVTLLMMSQRVERMITHDASSKAREALSHYVGYQVKQGKGINQVLSLLKRLPDDQRWSVINISNDEGYDVLSNILRNQIKHRGSLDEFLQFKSLGYQLNNESTKLLISYAETALAGGDASSILQVVDILKTLPDNQLGLVIESDGTTGKGMMYHLIQHAFLNPTNMLHMFGEFQALGFHLKEYIAYEVENEETSRAVDALMKFSQCVDIREDKEEDEFVQLLSSRGLQIFSQLQFPFEEGNLQHCQLYVRFNMEGEDISTIQDALDRLKELLSEESQKIVSPNNLDINDILCYIIRYNMEKDSNLDLFVLVENIGRPLKSVKLMARFQLRHGDNVSDDAGDGGVMFKDMELLGVLLTPGAHMDTYV